MQEHSAPAAANSGSPAFPRPEEAGAVVIIGAGLVGLPAGLVFTLAGYTVRLVEVDEGRRASVPERVAALLSFMVDRGLVEPAAAEAAQPRVSVASSSEAAAAPHEGRAPALVLEAVFENLELKQRALAEAEQHIGPDVIMCSVTSGLSITAIAGKLRHPERFCGAHFWNPPHLIPLVEVIYGEHTAERTAEAVFALMKFAGKTPVYVRKDVPGFIGNRLLHALQKEAMAVVASGVASAADVDLVVTEGFGRRCAVLGPLTVCDLAGLDLILDVDSYLIRDLDRSPEPSPLLVQLVQEGKIGVKSLQGFHTWTEAEVRQTIARRDAALIRALQVDRQEEAAGDA
jgi:3-hydroxybutyryl-CoA dehydrogenase